MKVTSKKLRQSQYVNNVLELENRESSEFMEEKYDMPSIMTIKDNKVTSDGDLYIIVRQFSNSREVYILNIKLYKLYYENMLVLGIEVALKN